MRTARAIVALALLGCSSHPGAPRVDPAANRASIYRDGDPRIASESRTLNRPDGDVVTLQARARRPPEAMVAIRKTAALGAGAGAIALPEVPPQAAPASIWLRVLGGPGPVRLERIWRQPSPIEPRGLRGRRVRARIAGETVAGTLIDIDDRGALVERDGSIWVLPAQALELPGAEKPAEPTRVDVVADRPGRYPIEVAYRTAALSWTLDLHLDVSAPDAGEATAEIAPVVAVDNRGAPLEDAVVTLFEGRHDDAERAARSIWSGRVSLPAGETRIPLPPRSVEASIGYRYRGFFGDQPRSRDRPGWGTASTEVVERVLRLPPGALPPAAAIAHVAVAGPGPRRRHQVAIAEAPVDGAPIDLVLEASSTIGGTRRQLWVKVAPDGSEITEAYELAVINRSDEAVAVRVVEPLERSDQVELVERPEAGRLVAGALEIELVVGANAREAIRYTARYRLRR